MRTVVFAFFFILHGSLCAKFPVVFVSENWRNKEDHEQVQQGFQGFINEEQDLSTSKREIYIASLIVFTLLFFISVLWYRSLLLKRKELFGKKMLLQQELLSRAIIESEELERSRIVKELHEGIGQQLSAAKLNISAVQSFLKIENDSDKIMLQNAVDLLDESVKNVRSVSRSMIPNALISSGFLSALKEYVNKINGMGISRINLEISGNIERRDQIKEIILFRILKEVINNSIKHSGTNQINVQLVTHETELSVLVEDEGKGFAVEEVLREGNGIGLKNIESRVAFLNGKIFYDSRPGKGTIVNIEIPL